MIHAVNDFYAIIDRGVGTGGGGGGCWRTPKIRCSHYAIAGAGQCAYKKS